MLVDGIDTREWDREELWRKFGVCFQDYVSYGFIARESIGIGNVTGMRDFDKILMASRQADAESIVESLPDKWETFLGKNYDPGGVDLSTGQWQKVAIARAMMRDCDIWVFDEPAASLDIDSGVALFLQLERMSRGKTVIYISHRLESVVSATRILLVSDGRVIEDGTHKELMHLGGEYARMFQLQLERLGRSFGSQG